MTLRWWSFSATPAAFSSQIDDLGDGRAVETVDPGDLFDDLAVLLDDPGVQAVGDRGLVLLVDDALVIGLDLGLGDALVEVDGGVRDQVLGRILGQLLGGDGRIEQDGREEGDQVVERSGPSASGKVTPSEPLTRAAK